MFRYKKSVGIPYERQGYIYFKSLLFETMSEEDRERIRAICKEAGGEYETALMRFVSTHEGAVKICMEFHISRSTLERAVRRYYRLWPMDL